jgi:tryptophan-rich sensory protein
MEIATKSQLRWAFLRWAMVTVPLILLLGFASGRVAASGEGNPWYAELAKPAINPPGWVFPVAWSALYILIGLALAMILNARGSRLRGLAIALFAAQMVANLAWSPLFFAKHQVFAALVVSGVAVLRRCAQLEHPDAQSACRNACTVVIERPNEPLRLIRKTICSPKTGFSTIWSSS